MALPEPSFITRDAAAITSEMIAAYELMTGKTLYPAQPERILIDLVAYRENLLRIGIQEAAKQNLVEYAVYPMIDYLGELVGVARLEAQGSKCTMRFTLVEALSFPVTVPAGTRVETKDGKAIFATDVNLTIAAGSTYGDVSTTCQTSGVAGNGYAIAQVNNLIDPQARINTVANTTVTSGGADEESDDHLRERIKLAPEKYSNAGSRGAYRYWALSSHQDIINVAVVSPQGGVVDIYPLTSSGQPSQEILDAVADTCSAETVRPLCDLVHALSPTMKTFAIEAQIQVFNTADGPTVQSAVEAALESYAMAQRSTLGRDVVLSQIIAVINGIAGVYKTVLVSPSADEVNDENEWSNCSAISVDITGYVDG
jgi:phage-related baseplate assembly protein